MNSNYFTRSVHLDFISAQYATLYQIISSDEHIVNQKSLRDGIYAYAIPTDIQCVNAGNEVRIWSNPTNEIGLSTNMVDYSSLLSSLSAHHFGKMCKDIEDCYLVGITSHDNYANYVTIPGTGAADQDGGGTPDITVLAGADTGGHVMMLANTK